jgi:hypothetical protein
MSTRPLNDSLRLEDSRSTLDFLTGTGVFFDAFHFTRSLCVDALLALLRSTLSALTTSAPSTRPVDIEAKS